MCNFLVATLREVSTYLRICTDESWAFHFMANIFFRWPEGVGCAQVAGRKARPQISARQRNGTDQSSTEDTSQVSCRHA